MRGERFYGEIPMKAGNLGGQEKEFLLSTFQADSWGGA